jgi:hypothetical protein
MVMVRTYLKGCEWCGATGKVPVRHPWGTAAPLEETCPVCNGTGTVVVTETDNSPDVNLRFSVYPKIEGKDLVGILNRQLDRNGTG